MEKTETAKSRGTKERIAAAALDQFWRKGYNGTSVQDLVAAAKAPKGTFYNHFASKEDLAVQTVRRYAAGWNLTALLDPSAGTPRERLMRHLEERVETGLDIAAEQGCLIANLAGEAPAHSAALSDAVAEHLTSWINALTTVIDDARRSKEVATTAIASHDLAEFIVNAWGGGAVKAKATGSIESVHAFERVVAELLR